MYRFERKFRAAPLLLVSLLTPYTARAAEAASSASDSTITDTAAAAAVDIPRHKCINDDSELNTQFAQWQAAGLPVGQIQIEQHSIFDENDPDENNWLFRGVNYLHINTHESVLRDDLLIKTGEPFDAEKVRESERILRRRAYVREPLITAVGECTERVDLKVQLHEVWTLMPQISYSHKGGESTSSLGLVDKNILGSGRELSVQFEKNVDYSRRYIGYRDPNWGNLHGILTAQFGQTDEGEFHRLEMERPFYALNTTWAGGIFTHQQIQTSALYFRGDKVQQFEQDRSRRSFYYGASDGLQGDHVARWFIGVAREVDLFSPVLETQSTPAIPGNRAYTYPFIGWQSIDAHYIKTSNVNQIGVTEDYNLGWQIDVKLGVSADVLSDAQNATVVEAAIERAFLFGNDKLLYNKWQFSGKYEQKEWRNSFIDATVRYHQGDFATQQFYVGLRARYGLHLDLDQYIYLGGDLGLRGYPLRYQVGDHSLLLNTEWRWFTQYELLQLADVGFAVFHDVGRAWFDDRDNGRYGGWLHDAGFGIRLAPTRIGESRHGGGTVIHIDLAFPFDAREDVGNYQWLVQAKQSF